MCKVAAESFCCKFTLHEVKVHCLSLQEAMRICGLPCNLPQCCIIKQHNCLIHMPILGTLTWLSSGKHMLPDHVNVAQVASHAQKYFIRLNSMNKKDKRRSSIHDITSVNPANGEIPGVGLFTTSLHALVQFDFACCIHAVMRVCCPERLWAGYALAISARQVLVAAYACMPCYVSLLQSCTSVNQTHKAPRPLQMQHNIVV